MTDATIDLNRLRVAQRNTDITSPDGTLPPDAPDWIWEVDNPYLHGPYAPIKTEMTVDELEVIGDLPADLCGAYIRNSPVPVHKPVNRYHAYDGDGMLQGVYFREAPFAPRLGAAAADAEDEGYVLTMTTDVSTWRSECLVFDARAISQGPIARVNLPQRLPAGFHTRWVRGEDIYQTC